MDKRSTESSRLKPPSRQITLSVHAGEVFANQQKALFWPPSPNAFPEGHTPLEAARTNEGFTEAEDILTRVECGVLG